MSPKPETAESCRVALVGVPNCGKTALFNRLTGSRQKVANYPGVTVERKEGLFHSADRRRHYRCSTCPAPTAWRRPRSTRRSRAMWSTGKLRGEAAPDLIVCVVDATNLRLNLRLVLELRAAGPADDRGAQHERRRAQPRHQLDRARLESELGLPVVETVAVAHAGERELVAALDAMRGARKWSG